MWRACCVLPLGRCVSAGKTDAYPSLACVVCAASCPSCLRFLAAHACHTAPSCLRLPNACHTLCALCPCLPLQAVFKEVVPITDPALKSKIHQTYR